MNFFQTRILQTGLVAVLLWGAEPRSALAANGDTGRARLGAPISAELETFAHALWRAEGGARARVPYGVISVKVRDAREAKAVALRSIARAAREHAGAVDERIFSKDFITFFARRWCPPTGDAVGHKNLVRNLQMILRDRKGKKI